MVTNIINKNTDRCQHMPTPRRWPGNLGWPHCQTSFGHFTCFCWPSDIAVTWDKNPPWNVTGQYLPQYLVLHLGAQLVHFGFFRWLKALSFAQRIGCLETNWCTAEPHKEQALQTEEESQQIDCGWVWFGSLSRHSSQHVGYNPIWIETGWGLAQHESQWIDGTKNVMFRTQTRPTHITNSRVLRQNEISADCACMLSPSLSLFDNPRNPSDSAPPPPASKILAVTSEARDRRKQNFRLFLSLYEAFKEYVSLVLHKLEHFPTNFSRVPSFGGTFHVSLIQTWTAGVESTLVLQSSPTHNPGPKSLKVCAFSEIEQSKQILFLGYTVHQTTLQQHGSTLQQVDHLSHDFEPVAEGPTDWGSESQQPVHKVLTE